MDYAQRVVDHYSDNWSKPSEMMRWKLGPSHELPDDFRVLVIRRANDMVAYATRCMSQPTDAERLEIHVLCRPELTNNLVEILTATAHYHRTGRPLGLGHSVNFGKPWVDGSPCTYGVLSLPYLDGPALEWMERPRTRFLWLIPITEAELRLRRRAEWKRLKSGLRRRSSTT